jgi:hypothetical protein
LLSWAGGPAIAEVFYLLWTQGTARVNGLDGSPLLDERWLNGRGWGFVDERPRLIGRPWSRSLELGRNGLRADGLWLCGNRPRRFRLLDGSRRYGLRGRRLCAITARRWFRLLHRPRRYGLRGRHRPRRGDFHGWAIISWNRSRGGRVGHRRRSDDLRLSLLREPGAVHRLRRRRCGLAGTVHRGRRLGRAY